MAFALVCPLLRPRIILSNGILTTRLLHPGITSSQVPVYLAEVAKKEKRGSIIVIQQLAIEVGILLMYFIGYGCSFIPGPTASFRTAWGIQWVPSIFLLCGLPFLPRSPRWLAKVGRTEEAVKILANIQAGGDQSDPRVVAEYVLQPRNLADILTRRPQDGKRSQKSSPLNEKQRLVSANSTRTVGIIQPTTA